MDSTRQGIVDSISRYCNRQDLKNAGVIDEWFEMAHIELQRLKDFKAQEDIWEETLQADVDTYGLGPNFINTLKKVGQLYVFNPSTNFPIAFYQVTSRTNMLQLQMGLVLVSNINQVPPSQDPAVADPGSLFASIWADQLTIFPRPISTSSFVGLKLRLDLWKFLTPPGTGATDWFTIWCRDYLLYRSLMEAAPYMQDDKRVQTWEAKLVRAQATIIGFSTDQDTAGQDLVMRG